MAKTKLKKGAEPLQPLNNRQKQLINAIKHKELIIVDGSAGTGKTFIAASIAAEMYSSGKIRKIILTRPNVPSGRSLGYFPGTSDEKMENWVKPFMNVLHQKMQDGAIETGIKNGNIEIVPFETMRGRSFDECFILLDEAQNTTEKEMEMFLTRLGYASTTVITGDGNQSDLPEDEWHGLDLVKDIVDRYGISNSEIVEFEAKDIVRSGLCKEFVIAFEEENKTPYSKR